MAVPPGEACYTLRRVWLDDADVDLAVEHVLPEHATCAGVRVALDRAPDASPRRGFLDRYAATNRQRTNHAPWLPLYTALTPARQTTDN